MSKARTAVRRSALRTFYYVNLGDITIRHHWTGDPFRLHTFRHKSYWYHFADGQRDSLLMAARLLKPADRVADVGGNIGYFTAFFSAMVGSTGRVDVFEPVPANLRYLRRNVAALGNVEVLESALSDEVGQAAFFVENLTGQNCSLINGYAPLERNSRHAGIQPRIEEMVVRTDTLDNRYAGADRLDFVKIDVEGGELHVLRGGVGVLRRLRPVLLLEISMNHEEVDCLLREAGYVLTSPSGAAVQVAPHEKADFFALHRTEHARLLEALGVHDRSHSEPDEQRLLPLPRTNPRDERVLDVESRFG